MPSERRRARVAGLLYLIVAVCGGFSELYVRASVKVAGDAAATADNISASATLFRVGALTDLVNVVCFLVLALVLYGLLKPVDARAALAMLAFNAVSVAVMTANMVNHLAALQAATSGDDALAMLFLDLHATGYLVAGTFFGLWLLPLGYLLFRSGYAPRPLGALVMVGAFGYVADLATRVLLPTAGETLGPLLVLPSALAELSLVLWLLVKGLEVQPRTDHVPALVRREESKLKAITYHRYGSPEVLEFQEVDEPVVRDAEVLVRVRAASANPRDWHFMRGLPAFMRLQFGLRRPKHHGLGSDVAGQVEAVGANVTGFRPGDEVYADVVMGGFAELAGVPEAFVAPKPANLTYEQAAAVPLAALTALQGLRDHGRVQPGQKVLIIGAAGGVGTFAVQLAKWLGAEVTGVCSTRNVELVRSLGADQVVDYTQEDVTRSGRRYDLVLQLAGTRSPSDLRRALTPTGTLLLSSGESDGRLIGPVDRIIKALLLAPFVRQRLVPFVATRSSDDLRVVKELIEAGTVTPVIDRTYPLSDVPEAIRYLEEGHARGKVVITL